MRYFDPPPTGFSLIELLVVVTIIAILVALLLPFLQSARATSLSALCQQHLYTIGTVVHAWMVDHDGEYPPNGANTDPAAHGADRRSDGKGKTFLLPISFISRSRSGRKTTNATRKFPFISTPSMSVLRDNWRWLT